MDEADKLAEEILAKCIALDWGDKSESFLAERIRDYGEACRRAGAEAMREAAAIAAFNIGEGPTAAAQIFTAIRSLPSATEAASPAAGWRPIDTAPKDGTRILTDWNLDGKRWVTITSYSADPENEGWLDSENMAISQRNWEPTHWMPLPASAPSEEARAG